MGRPWWRSAKPDVGLRLWEITMIVLGRGKERLHTADPKINSRDLIDTFEALVESAQECSVPSYMSTFRLDQSGLCVLIFISLRLAIEDRNPKLVKSALQTVLLLINTTQFKDSKECVLSSPLLDMIASASCPENNSNKTQESKSERNSTSEALKRLLRSVSEILPLILPATSGFSQQAAEFSRSRNLCIQYHDFDGLSEHLSEQYGRINLFTARPSGTVLSADSVLCATTDSEAMKSAFDHVWVPFGLFRMLMPILHHVMLGLIDRGNCLEKVLGWIVLFIFIVLALLCALAGLAIYPLLLVYVYFVDGMGMYSAAEVQKASEQQGAADNSGSNIGGSGGEGGGPKETHHDLAGRNKPAISMTSRIYKIIARPYTSFVASLRGNQSVAGHVLCLPGMGSFKMLKALLAAPIDIFEAPSVRAAVEGVWSRFKLGFFVRFALFVVQLLLYSAFATWCIAWDISYSTLNVSQDQMVRASFIGGCVAAGIGAYFLAREVLQCCSCVADDGLKEYFEFWNAVQVCSHSLELISFAMFVSGSDPVSTRIVATYAVFSLWIDLLYFTKAIRQISFLLEILTAIIADMLPFTLIMMILIMAVAVALQVLVPVVNPDPAAVDQTFNSSFGLLFGMAFRMAEGRQDIAGSPLEDVAAAVYERADFGPTAQNTIVYTIYLGFYFLLTVITVVALNALIALMGSSYEKVMEKKISQRLLEPLSFL
jgi:hypothetical protein